MDMYTKKVYIRKDTLTQQKYPEADLLESPVLLGYGIEVFPIKKEEGEGNENIGDNK